MISLAKLLDHLSHPNGLESVDSEMKSPAYQNVEVRHFAAATCLAWLAEEYFLTSMATLSLGNASSAEQLLLTTIM
jgi:hypothetical protein